MPLANAVLDFHPLGVIDTPDGPRERVVLVAAQRDMIESLLDAVRSAGLQPEGVDLSAFALIRSLYRANTAETGRVLYLNVDGLTNLAIADGPVCSFTRVVGSGLEGMAADLAERRGIPVATARELIARFDLDAPASADAATAVLPEPAEDAASEELTSADVSLEGEPLEDGAAADAAVEDEAAEAEAHEAAAHPEPHAEAWQPEPDFAGEPDDEEESAPLADASEEDVRAVVENGIREIAGEVRNSLDFHRSQEPVGEVAHVSLSGAAVGISGFAEALGAALDIEVRTERIPVADKSVEGTPAAHRLAVATGLATVEAPR
jgi:Tfp pilus assembly PilM family ATPase